MPHSSHIFGGMLLPDTGAVFIERHIQGPMQLVLNVPMLTNHTDEGGGRSPQTGNVDAVVTRDRRPLMRHPNRFDDNHRVETRPFRQLRQGKQVSDRPDPSPYCAAVRVIEGIKEILGGAPGHRVLNVLMAVLVDSAVRFCGGGV